MAYKWAVLLCMMPGITVFLIDATVVNVALAKLGAVFGVDVATVQWTVTAFALASGIATPAASFIEARFTLKRVWISALSAFTTGSLLCGLAPAFWVLVVGRLAQGLAGGLLLPMAVSELFRSFPPNQRGLALGFFAIPLVAGPALGPTVGGYIVTYLDWRLVFFINLPVGVTAALLALFLLRPGRAQMGRRFDTVGAILSTLAFGSILYGLSQVSQDGWGSFTVRGMLGLGLTSLAFFITYEVTREDPLLDVRLFAQPQFLIANAVGWVSTVALFGAEFMLPLYLQNLRGLSAVNTGLLLLPQGFAVAFAGPIAGRLVDRIGARFVVVFGFVLLSFNTWQMANITLDTTYDTLRWLVIVRGIALGCALQPTQLVALSAVPAQLRTNASSLNVAMRNVVQSLGIAMLSTVVQTQSVVHAAVLSWQVSPDTVQGAAVGQISGFLQANDGLSAAAANLSAISIMMGQVTQQATALAFDDAYRITFFAALLSILVAALLPGRGGIRTDPSMMAGG
jgi:MFS transporter, DHA2 family, multidrug resistance protein